MTLELNEEDTRDLQNIVAFALRYTQGRKTYAFSVVSAWIIDHADIMQPWQLKQMAEEIEQGISMWKLDGWEEANYLQVAKKLKRLAEEIGTRESVRVKHDKD